jgi:ribonuclease E
VQTEVAEEEKARATGAKPEKTATGRVVVEIKQQPRRGRGAHSAGARRDEPGAKRDEPGAKRDEPGAKRDEPGAKRDEPGAKRDEGEAEAKPDATPAVASEPTPASE